MLVFPRDQFAPVMLADGKFDDPIMQIRTRFDIGQQTAQQGFSLSRFCIRILVGVVAQINGQKNYVLSNDRNWRNTGNVRIVLVSELSP